jgi:membrane-associated phospholipid phosphatase
MFWTSVTDLGDSAVTLPLAAASFVFLAVSGWRRGALLFALTVMGCGAVIGLSKLLLESCGERIIDGGAVNPSGHVAMSTVVYGSLAVLLGCSAPPLWRWSLLALAGLLAATIGASRVALGAHTPVEVASGFGIGLFAVIAFDRLLRAGPIKLLRPGWLAAAALVIILAMHGSRWPIENAIHSLVALLRHHVPQCAAARAIG